MWVLGEGRVSTGGSGNPAVAGAQVAEAGGVGSWAQAGVRRVRWSSGSQAEMEGRRGESCSAREMGSLQRGQPSCSRRRTLSVRSWR